MAKKQKKRKQQSSVDVSAKKPVEMNEELQEWIKESREKDITVSTKEKLTEPMKKKVTGKCQICGQNKAKFLCVNCGAPTCTSCYFHLVGLCKNCLEKRKGEKWKGMTPNWEKTLGVQWID